MKTFACGLTILILSASVAMAETHPTPASSIDCPPSPIVDPKPPTTHPSPPYCPPAPPSPPYCPPAPTASPETPVPPVHETEDSKEQPDPDPKRRGRATLYVKVLANGEKPLDCATVIVDRGSRSDELTTDEDGRAAGLRIRHGVEFTVTVKADGFLPAKFTKVFARGADWGIAKVHLYRPQLSKSFVAEWRVARNSSKENPERDFALFIFDVNYYKDKKAIEGAHITLTRPDEKVTHRLCTDEDGRAEILIREKTAFAVRVKAQSYADYTTRVAPGLRATRRRVNVFLKRKP